MPIKIAPPTKLQKKIIRKHFIQPLKFPKRAAMIELGIGFNYNRFNTLFYRVIMELS